MNKLPPQHTLVPTSSALGESVAPRCWRTGFVWNRLLLWLPTLALLLALPSRQSEAQAVRLPNADDRQSERRSQAPWVAWEVVTRNQVETVQAQSEPDACTAPGTLIANDGLRPLTEVTLDIQPVPGEVPPDVAAHKFAQAGQLPQPMGACRPWHPSVFSWEAPALCYRPLYFEEVNLERYGYSCGVAQPFVSAAHFFGTVPAMPYLMTVDKPRECVYTLGHYLPGSCAPYHTYFPPPSLKAGLVEAAVVTGLIFVLP